MRQPKVAAVETFARVEISLRRKDYGRVLSVELISTVLKSMGVGPSTPVRLPRRRTTQTAFDQALKEVGAKATPTSAVRSEPEAKPYVKKASSLAEAERTHRNPRSPLQLIVVSSNEELKEALRSLRKGEKILAMQDIKVPAQFRDRVVSLPREMRKIKAGAIARPNGSAQRVSSPEATKLDSLRMNMPGLREWMRREGIAPKALAEELKIRGPRARALETEREQPPLRSERKTGLKEAYREAQQGKLQEERAPRAGERSERDQVQIRQAAHREQEPELKLSDFSFAAPAALRQAQPASAIEPAPRRAASARE